MRWLFVSAALLVARQASAAPTSDSPRRLDLPKPSYDESLVSVEPPRPTTTVKQTRARPTPPPAPWPHLLPEPTDLASSFEPTHRFDARVSIAYLHRELRGQLKRELDGAVAEQTTSLVFRDLVFARTRDELALRADVGLFRDLALWVELPIVLSERTDFRFDRGARPCTLPPAASPSCVDAANSTTIADGIAPSSGYDATRAGAATADPLVFRGARRGAIGGSGADALDTLALGLGWAPFSQRRDPSKPTWIIAIEPRLSIGTIRAFDRSAPDASHGVSDGVHRIHFRTAVSRRLGRWQPYASLSYLLPFARSGSAFTDYGPAETTKDPQHQASASLGTEILAYERGRPDWRVTVDVRAKLEGHFAGRGYSEAWELFAGSPALACDATQNPACDATQTKNAYQGRPFSGLTAIDGYATLGLELAVDALLTRWLRVRAGFAYARDQSHLITGDVVGITPAGTAAQPSDYNPAYRPVVDQPGRRYVVDNVDTFDFKLTVQARF